MKKAVLLIPALLALAFLGYQARADTVEVNATVSPSISVVFQYSAVDFGSLTQGTSDNPAPNQADGVYNVTVTTNANYKVEASGTDFSDGAGHTFAISNLKMDTNSTAGNLALGDAVALSTSAQTIDTNIPYTETTNYHGFWLTIPSNQYAATYSSTVTITYSNV